MVKLFHKILANLSKKVIKKYKPLVIGITGSVGKSSTKEALYIILRDKFNVRRSFKNYNNEIGLPLTIFGFSSPGKSISGWLKIFFQVNRMLLFRINYPEILILEMAADHPGDIRHLIDIANPQIGVVTAVGLTHTEFFKNVDSVAKEKQNIISNLTKKDWAILNIDNEYIEFMIDKTMAQVLTFGLSEKADIQATEIHVSQSLSSNGIPQIRGLTFKVNYQGSIVPVFIPRLISQAQVYSILGAITVGLTFDLNLIDIVKGLPKYKGLPGRLNMISGTRDTILLDDTYNSSPEAVKLSLSSLDKIKIAPGAKKWIVLGDMLELGELSSVSHQKIGEEVGKMKPDYLVVVGKEAQEISEGAQRLGLSLDRIFNFKNAEEAGDFLQNKIQKGDILLIKGSQGVRLEKIVKQLMLHPEQAKKLLVRQGQEWR
ncbi:MAG: UDP-N-acetylmuramoyl-tripeptide--D-alanyl-D-alanine ligase [Bacteroidales bacterium]|nr:UDP-N-acetylmuramoyl-tripeptide--D-alanyl-D-alanine ligase [Bacteroidales bacterium]